MIDGGSHKKDGVSARDQAKDTGMALSLVCILIGIFGQKPAFFSAAGLILFLTMAWPAALKPAAKVWFGFSHLLGTVMTKVVLSVVFFLVVTPIGLLRRAMGKDSLGVSGWRKGRGSAFVVRDHAYTAHDVETPF